MPETKPADLKNHLYIALLFFYLSPAAQPPVQADKKKDSLFRVVTKTKEDSTRVLALYDLGVYYVDNHQVPELLANAKDIISLSRKIKFQRGEGLGNYLLAWYDFWSFQTDSNYRHIGRAIDILKNSGDEINYSKALLQQIALSNSMGNSEEALQYCRITEPILLKLGDQKDIYELYDNFSAGYGNTSDHLKALEYDLKSEKVARQMGDQIRIANSCHYIAWDFARQHEDSMAYLYVQKSIAINKTLPDRYWPLASNNFILSDINNRKGKYRESLGFNLETYEYFDKHDTANFVPQRCQILNQIGEVYELIGDSAQKQNNNAYASEYWQKALDYYLDAHNRYYVFYKKLVNPIMAKSVGKIYYKMGDIRKSREYLMAALKQSKTVNNKGWMAEIYLYLAKGDSLTGDFQNAYTNLQNYHLYHDSIFIAEKSKTISYYKSLAESEKNERELELLAAENRLKTSLANQQKQKRKLAYALSGLVLLGTGYGVTRYRKLNRQKSEQRRLKERLAISQDLHDHVGSTLSSISVFSKVAQVEGEKGNTGQMNELLDRIRNTSGKMMTEMNDIVWAINPQNDTMEKIIQRMESFARPLLTARNMQFHFNYSEIVKSLNLEMEQRKNFFLIFKEAVNNAIKYSGGSLLEADIRYEQAMLELTVKDNGVGFNIGQEMNETRSLSGNGLRNMNARAKAMNANFQITSEPGNGTKIRLILPLI